MTVPVQSTVTASIANGVTTDFPYAFKIAAAEDLIVLADGVEVTTGFYVTGVGEEIGGSVIFSVAPANGVKILRVLSPIIKRLIDYQQFGDWNASVVNSDMDKIWLALQAMTRDLARSLKLPFDTASDQVITEDPADRATKAVKFDADGNLTVSTYDVDEMRSASEAAASTATAAASVASSEAAIAAEAADVAVAAAATVTPVETQTHAAAGKSTPANDDEIPIVDSADGFSLKKILWSSVKTALNTLYMAYVAPGTAGNVLTSDGSGWVSAQFPEGAYSFSKADSTTPAFTKTSANTLSVKAGSSAEVSGVNVSWLVATAVTMPALTGGTDYAIYVCADGSLRADPNWSAPTGYTTANSRKIGGFHYGLVAAGTTVAGGSFNAAGSPTTGGMVWTQGDVDKIAGINEFSLWDLKFRPACADPRGMVLVNGRTWVDIYLCSTDTAANGTSKAGSNIASGTVLPKLPVAFGGDGTLTYGALNWWVANELARANQKRLMLASEFYDAAFGVTENQSIDATASTYPATQRNAGYTSRYGIEQATGVHYIWGQDSAGSSAAWTANGGRGQSYNSAVFRVLLGGARANGSSSGSRCSSWSNVSSGSNWFIGLRAASDHIQLL